MENEILPSDEDLYLQLRPILDGLLCETEDTSWEGAQRVGESVSKWICFVRSVLTQGYLNSKEKIDE